MRRPTGILVSMLGAIALTASVAGCTRTGPAPVAPARAVAPAPAAVAAAVAPATAAKRPAREAAPAPAEAPAPVVHGERTPLGDAPRAVAESTTALDRSSPAKTVAELSAALDRADEAALARLHAGSASKPALDEQDLLRARIDFLGERESHWRRVLSALDREKLGALDASGERAVLRVDVGGALGVVDLVFVKEGAAWAVGL